MVVTVVMVVVVGGKEGREGMRGRDSGHAGVDFAFVLAPALERLCSLESSSTRPHLGRRCRLRPAQEAREHLPGLVAVVVDRLLAKEHNVGLFLVDDGLEDAGDAKRLDGVVVLHVYSTVGPHSQGRSNSLLALHRANGDDHHLIYDALITKAFKLGKF